MGISIHFMGLDRPLLHCAADFLFDRYRSDGQWDLRDVIVVVPGGRAGRRLLEILVQRADAEELILTPPRITTVGFLPELLYRPKRAFASELVQQFVWADVLRCFDRAELQTLVRRRPDSRDVLSWMELGQLLARLHRHLASYQLNFQDVYERLNAENHPDAARWQLLALIQQQYLQALEQLELWDYQTARYVAIRQLECATDRDIVMVGTVDLDQLMRSMLDQVADRVSVLIAAPETWRDRFDSHGCLIAAKWRDVETPFSDEQILLADDPLDQAECIVRWVADRCGDLSPEEITIGVPDARLAPLIERRLASIGVAARYGPGRPLTRTPVGQLLAGVTEYLSDRRFDALAALVRHADVGDWFRQSGLTGQRLAQLDQLHNERLPARVTSELQRAAHEQLRRLIELVEELIAPLAGGERPLSQWAEPIRQVLARVYGDQARSVDDAEQHWIQEGCRRVASLLEQLEALPPSLDFSVSSVAALQLVLRQASGEMIPEPVQRSAVELVGWLDLPLDDAAAAVVSTFNEGYVPTSVGTDLFLPNSLRAQLGLDDNDRRYARDAYAAQLVAACGRRAAVVVGRRDAEGNPLVPSRLLLAGPPQLVAERAKRLFDGRQAFSRKADAVAASDKKPARPVYEVLQPAASQPIDQLAVTAFRDYLACPFRFYLRHVLKLEALDDAAEEMDAAVFGSLAHEVLAQFARCSSVDRTDEQAMRDLLDELLKQVAGRQFGSSRRAAVAIQLEQLRRRLHGFARWQASHARQGWRIDRTEVDVPERTVRLDVDGKPFYLKGRIDRIDVHSQTGETLVLDYKTSSEPTTPEKAHRKNGQWIDLQLPLYRRLARALGYDGPIKLGYVALSKNEQVELLEASWSEEELDEAEEVARQVIRQIRGGVFWPPAKPAPPFCEDLAPICMDGVFVV